MKNIILFDNLTRDQLLPLTYYRPVAEVRVGILTIREKWELTTNCTVSYLTQDYLSRKFPTIIERDNTFIAGNVLPTKELVALIDQLHPKEGLAYKGQMIAANIPGEFMHPSLEIPINDLTLVDLDDISQLIQTADIFLMNGDQIKTDFKLVTKNRVSQPIPKMTTVIGHHPIFIEMGATVMAQSINVTDGPVYIGKNALIMEGCLLRGPLAFGESAVAKMGAKIYKDTTIGPFSKVGGELSNCVFFGYSNKGHDGYLGNSIVAEWCNLGADTNCSNLKNNYSPVNVWNYPREKLASTDIIFHGLIFADHSKASINTMFNTATTVGVNANVVAGVFPPKFIPSFTWNVHGKASEYELHRAIETATKVMARRKIVLSKDDQSIMEHVFIMSHNYRKKYLRSESI